MRAIDGKYHIQGERIIKTGNGEAIPEDEPLILFRARDQYALDALSHYGGVCRERGCTTHQLNAIAAVIDKFEQFAQEHAGRMKEPGATKGR